MSLLQSCLAILEQCAHLAQAEKPFEPAATLLGFDKCVDFVEGSDRSSNIKGQREHSFSREATHSVNCPICFNTLGGNSPPVSDMICTVRTVFSNW
jgi:hypothetical protein